MSAIDEALTAQREAIARMLTEWARLTEESERRLGMRPGPASGAFHYAAQLVRESTDSEQVQ